jgi:hypothetical protein
VIGITSPVISKDANNVFMMGPGLIMTLSANIPMMLIKMYCPSRPTVRLVLKIWGYHSIDDAVMIRSFSLD